MREIFINFPPVSGNKHFCIVLAGITYPDETYRISRERADCMVMEYVISGQGTVILDGQTFEVKAGDIYLLPKGHNHSYYADKTNPWEKIWCNVEGTLPEKLLAEYNPRNMVVFEGAGGLSYFQQIHKIGEMDSYSAEEKHNKAALIFHELLQYLYTDYYGKEQKLSEETLCMKTYLDNHVAQKISLKELGDMVFLSESQIVRLFKRDLGMTPYEYSLSLKLDQAKKLLRNSRLQVREIAEYLAFCDEHYFSYIFKKKTGQTPLEYRRNM